MKPGLSRYASLLLVLLAFTCLNAFSQSEADAPGTLTIRAESRLVLVDVIPEQKTKEHGKALVTTMRKEDFRVFDNGKEVPVSTFDIGVTRRTRPIALWLIVQCPQGFNSGWASDFMRGNTHFLKPGLVLDEQDVVGVAHWCDNGVASIDLPSGHDPDAALAEVENQLNKKLSNGHDREGELAMQKLIRMVVEDTHSAKPDRLPVLLFIYGDHGATYASEAEKIIESILQSSGVVFGISDNGWRYDADNQYHGGQIYYLVHHYARETGGEFYSTPDMKLFSSVLGYILTQLHVRYTLGFAPTSMDGKTHAIKVELSKEAKGQYSGIDLRFRKSYIPLRK